MKGIDTMKVKVHVIRDVEVEIDDPIVAALDSFWRNNKIPISYSPELNEMVDKADLAVEEVTGIPFGDEDAPETIAGVCAMDGEPILEW